MLRHSLPLKQMQMQAMQRVAMRKRDRVIRRGIKADLHMVTAGKGLRETARRRVQIAAGQLQVSE